MTQASYNASFGSTADLIASLSRVAGYASLLLTSHPLHPLYGPFNIRHVGYYSL